MGPRNFREYPVWKEAVDYATFVMRLLASCLGLKRRVYVTSFKELWYPLVQI